MRHASESKEPILRWIRCGAVCGVAACVVYPSLIFIPLPDRAAALLAAAWGPLLGIASLGLCKLLQVERRLIGAQLGAVLNIAAGALVTSMLLVQIAAGMRASGEKVPRDLVSVWLGLDVAWDVYVGLGTAFFAWAMLRHARFGVVFGASGLVVAVVLLALNLYTFPEPPGEAGLFDAGPFVGLWYLAVSIRAWRSLGWAARALDEKGDG
jgi:hypothetical protein